MSVAEHDIHSTPSREAVEQIVRWAVLHGSDPSDTDPRVVAAFEAASHGSPQQFTAALADLAAFHGPGSRSQGLLATVWGNGDAAGPALSGNEDLRALYRTAAQRGEDMDVAEIATTHGLRLRAEATGAEYQTEVFVEGEAGRGDILASRSVTAASAADALKTAAAHEHAIDGLDELDVYLINVQVERLKQLIALEQKHGKAPTTQPALGALQSAMSEARYAIATSHDGHSPDPARWITPETGFTDRELQATLDELATIEPRSGVEARHLRDVQALIFEAVDARDAEKRSTTAATAQPADERWLAVVASAAGRDLGSDPGWAMLSSTLDRAQASGWAVAEQLPDVAGQGAVNSEHTAHDLAYRVMDACPAAISPAPTAAEMNGPAAPQSSGRAREAAEAAIQRPQPPASGHTIGR